MTPRHPATTHDQGVGSMARELSADVIVPQVARGGLSTPSVSSVQELGADNIIIPGVLNVVSPSGEVCHSQRTRSVSQL